MMLVTFVAMIGGAVFVALRAPGRAESEANAGIQAAPSLSPVHVR